MDPKQLLIGHTANESCPILGGVRLLENVLVEFVVRMKTGKKQELEDFFRS